MNADAKVPEIRARARAPLYDEAVRAALIVLWDASDRVCGKRLQPLLRILLPALERNGHLKLQEPIREKLLAMSAATVDRLLRVPRASQSKRPRRLEPMPKRRIRMRTFADWNEPLPGCTENRANFFKGMQYMRFDPATRSVFEWARPIYGNWKGDWFMAKPITTAFHWQSGKIYFFCGSEYVRYDLQKDAIDFGPAQIAPPAMLPGAPTPKPNWPGVWAGGFDTAGVWSPGKGVFFKGYSMRFYDIKQDAAGTTLGLAKTLPGFWPFKKGYPAT